MREFLMDLWSFMRERKKFWLFSYHHVAGSARRIDRSYFGICCRAVHLHALLAWSRSRVGPEGPPAAAPRILWLARQPGAALLSRAPPRPSREDKPPNRSRACRNPNDRHCSCHLGEKVGAKFSISVFYLVQGWP